jgi:hypothetical protein
MVSTITVRDRLWLFGMPVEPILHPALWVPKGRLMTTLEAAMYLGIPNALWGVQRNFPEPPWDTHVRPLTPLKRVVLSALGEAASDRNDLDEVLRMAEQFPNVTGAILDDFFGYVDGQRQQARFSLDELKRIADRLHSGPRRLDLYVVIYSNQLDLPLDDYLACCDVVTYWHWWAPDLANLEPDFAQLEQRAGHMRKMLGCYFTDMGGGEPAEGTEGEGKIPLELMRQQCETGLKWLREGRIEGIILLGNYHCGFGIETVEWTKQWIAEVGDQAL